jgi:hypothetical protein
VGNPAVGCYVGTVGLPGIRYTGSPVSEKTSSRQLVNRGKLRALPVLTVLHFRVLGGHMCHLSLPRSPSIRYGRNVMWHSEADHPAFRHGDSHGEGLMTRGMKKKRAGCDHYDHPVWMMALWGHYQARCLGCETVGPMVDGEPWAAQDALYAAVSVRPD